MASPPDAVARHFKQYLGGVYGGQRLPPEQLKETRRAFYAGAASLTAIIFDVGDAEGEAPGDQFNENVTAVLKELDIFADGLDDSDPSAP